MIVTHPDIAAKVVRECADLGIRHVWLHRSFGQGSVSEEAAAECERHNINCLVGGCPMMYCEPVDFGHRCMRWILKMQSRLPGLSRNPNAAFIKVGTKWKVVAIEAPSTN